MKEMPFDGIVTRAITKELQEKLVGGRINKIYQPTSTELILTIRNNRENYSLLISIHPSYARIHLTQTTILNPPEPPMFCMVLRKHLQGAVIDHLEQIDFERIISLQIRGRNEIGDETMNQLMIEIMGKHSNVLLVERENNKIINCIKHVPPFQNRYRTLLPGSEYKLPPQQDKLDLLKSEATQFVRKLDFNAGKMDRQIVQTITGLSPFIAKEIVHRAGLGSQHVYEVQFENLQEEVRKSRYHYAIYENGREDFHVLPISYLKETSVFNEANELVDAFYLNKAERDRIKQQSRDYERIIKNELAKNERKIKLHEKTLKQAEKAAEQQKFGELLTANMHQMQKGMSHLTVIDYYDENQAEISIPLQADLTPSENAQTYFKKYRKLITAAKRAQTEMEKTAAEISYLESILQQIHHAHDGDLEDIRTELQEEGYIKTQNRRGKKRSKPRPEKFLASDGTEIYVGKNNKQNEYATFKLAHKDDTWLHTLDIPGAHVIIKSPDPSEQTLLEAAQLAAYYSKAQQSDSVPVDYTKVKHVKKQSGAKPGFVIYTDQKTLFVTPKKLSE